ncbi:MAG: DUF1616 domain-containing protein [Candidatus Hydrothermarchaeales archaeon]
MNILVIIRGIVGFTLVFFIPGHALTLAMWSKKKREVYEDILKILREKDISSVTLVGKSDNLESLEPLLDENKIRYKTYTRDAGKENEDDALIIESENLILMDSMDLNINPKDKFIIDLGNNLEAGGRVVKVEDTLDGLERFALSIGLSIAIAPLLGLLLDKTGIGITFGSIMGSIILVSAVLFGVYFKRRSKDGL